MTRVQTRRLAWGAALLLAVGSVAFTGPPAYAAGTTWWVDGSSPVCSDTVAGAGSQTTPFCTISKGVAKAITPGDTVQVAPGTYREQVTVAASGTPTDPISIVGNGPGVIILGTQALGGAANWSPTATNAWSRPYNPPSAPKQVFLDGQRLTAASSATSTTSGSYFYDTGLKVLYVDVGGANPGDGHLIEAGAQSFGVNVSGKHDVVVRGFDIRRQNFGGVRVLSSSAVTVQNISASESASNGVLVDTCTSGVVIDHADVSGSLSTGIRLSATSGATISASSSHGNGLHGIGLYTSTGNLVSGNTVYGNTSINPSATAAGIDVNTSSPDNTIRGNTLYNNQDSGVQVYNSSQRALVVRNIAYNNGDHGFDTLASTGVRYVNNTAYSNRRDGISVEGNSTGASLANNVLMDNGLTTNEYDIYVDTGSVTGFSADYDTAYNTVAKGSVRVGTVVYPKLTDYASASGQETHGQAVDPAFVNATSADFRLKAGSAAVDSANAAAAGFDPLDAVGSAPADDPIVPDTGSGSPTFADRGALEHNPATGQQNYAPHAAVVLDPQTVSVPPGASVTADASGSSDSDLAGIASYTFDFGDGSVVGPQANPVAVHVFRAVGTYTVNVTVQDTAGLTDSATAQEIVNSRTIQAYHVEQTSASCTDTGPGSAATPFCTITQATKVALAGDTVLVGPGQYREQVRVTNSGEPGAPVTYQATSSAAVVLGTDDASDPTSWSSTSTNAWKRSFTSAAVPAQVFLDGQPLAKAPSATQTTTGTWFYDAGTSTLYVDNGGTNPASGHTIAVGARNYGFLLRQVTDVVIDGFTARQQNFSGVYLDQSDNSTVKNMTVAQAGSHGVTVDGSSGVTLTNVDSSSNMAIGVRFFDSADSTLRNAVTHNNGFHGVSVQGSRRILVTGVTSYANLKPGQRIAAGIDVSLSSVDTIVESNTTYGNDDSGIEAYTGSTGTIVRRNLTYDNGDHGIDNFAAVGSVVVSNTVVANATAGINFEGNSTGATVRDNVTLNNAVGSTRTIGEIRVDESSEAGISMNRDLVFQTSGGPLFEWSSQPYTTLAGFSAVSGMETAGLAANPQFANLATRDLRLTGRSPAIDAADTALQAWQAVDRVGATPIDDPAVADTGLGPVTFADLGALEYVGPAARATITPTSGVAPLDVTVDASATTALGAPITTYGVQCGNGTTVTQQVSHCLYSGAGTFTITLTVTDAAGLRDSLTQAITVSTDSAPTVTLTATPAQQYVPQVVTLDASGSTDTDATPIASYSFNCGNGQTTGPQPGATTSCNYTTAGNFSASVTVKDTAGLATTKKVTVRILADAAPSPNLQLSSAKIQRGQSITADASGSTDVDKTPIATYRFDCGNGTVTGQQTSATTVCTYPSIGTFTVQVWVTDTLGQVASTTKKVQVQK